MIAPVLARLDQLAGVAVARVDAGGRYFVVDWRAGEAALPEAALALLGPGSYVVTGPRAEAQLSALRQGELWLTAATSIALSWVELRLLANRWGAVAAGEAGLGPVESDELIEALRVEMGREFQRVHDGGGTSDSNWYRAAFPLAWERATASVEGARAAVVLAALQRQLAG